MIGNNGAALRQYQSVDVATRVAGADRNELIGILLGGALQRLAMARGCIERGDAAGRGEALSRVLGILEALTASLDFDAGGDLAEDLAALYDYMGRRVLRANLDASVEAVDEVVHLLRDLRETWGEVTRSQQAAAAV